MTGRWFAWVEKLPLAPGQPVLGYAAAVAFCALGLGIRFATGGALAHGFPFITFVPAVVLSAFLFGPGPGIVAGIVSWLMARYYFIEPIHSFALTREAAASLVFYALIVAVDVAIIAFMQRANRELRRQRERSYRQSEMRKLMFHELQHRVSNKLQIIASLLTLQKRTVVDPDAQKALEDAARRVGMIGRISRALHDPERQTLGVAAFLEQVGRDIIEASGATNVTLSVKADQDIELESDAGVPVALIIAETISNALEHAFDSFAGGSITIEIQRSESGEVIVSVIDDGLGVPMGFDVNASTSLGLTIATTLARQLGGRYDLRRAPLRGTVAELRIAL